MIRIGTRWLPATVTSIRHRLSIEDLQPNAAHTLACNEIGTCHFSVASPVAFDAYADNRETGAFILVDRDDNRTVAGGTILFPLRRAGNIRRETLSVDKAARSAMKGQKACVIWFTGLPASGKSTIAKRVDAALHRMQRHTYMLDGDNLRHGLNRDLGFTEADRAENVRRVGETAKMFVDAGLIAICAFVSPYRADRLSVRELLEPDEFIEVFVDTPLDECMRRDPKGLYAKARRGELDNFTGIGAPYEVPDRPELVLSTLEAAADELAERVIAEVLKRERPA
jgi:bifunctional enzyme CysN/CysC